MAPVHVEHEREPATPRPPAASRSGMRLVLCAALALVAACDPQLSISGTPLTKRTIEDCPEAVSHLRECCPQYESYLSCTVLEKWEGAETADLTARQSRCLRGAACAAIEKAVTQKSSFCGVAFQGQRCH